MYLEKDFLQNKFVEGMRGQKFTFSDTLVLNILNQSQSVILLSNPFIVFNYPRSRLSC